jgi:hypothetical protein
MLAPYSHIATPQLLKDRRLLPKYLVLQINVPKRRFSPQTKVTIRMATFHACPFRSKP